MVPFLKKASKSTKKAAKGKAKSDSNDEAKSDPEAKSDSEAKSGTSRYLPTPSDQRGWGVGLGQHGHDKQLTFESPRYYTLEINTPNEMTLVIGIDDNNEAALLRLFPRKKIGDVKETGFVKEVLLIFNSVSQIYYSIEDVDTNKYDEPYLLEFQQRLDRFRKQY